MGVGTGPVDDGARTEKAVRRFCSGCHVQIHGLDYGRTI